MWAGHSHIIFIESCAQPHIILSSLIFLHKQSLEVCKATILRWLRCLATSLISLLYLYNKWTNIANIRVWDLSMEAVEFHSELMYDVHKWFECYCCCVFTMRFGAHFLHFPPHVTPSPSCIIFAQIHKHWVWWFIKVYYMGEDVWVSMFVRLLFRAPFWAINDVCLLVVLWWHAQHKYWMRHRWLPFSVLRFFVHPVNLELF